MSYYYQHYPKFSNVETHFGTFVFRGGNEVCPVGRPLQVSNFALKLMNLYVVKLFTALCPVSTPLRLSIEEKPYLGIVL